MDWYCENGIDDYIVPKDQGLSDRILSPESWSKWGISDPESFQDLDKCFVFDQKSTREESSYNGSRSICDEVGMEDSVHDKYQSNCSSIYGGSSNDTLQQNTLSCDQHDFQLEGLPGFEQMDDIFLNSLLEDLPEDGIEGKILCPEPSYGMTQSGNPLSDTNLDCHSNASSIHSVGSLTHQKKHAFSPSSSSKKGDFNASEFVCNSKQNGCLPMKRKILVPCEQNTTKGQIGYEMSLEETILHDLKTVTTQLTENTRICFRDSLYRLAKNSGQYHITQNQDGDIQAEMNLLETDHAEIMRSRPKRATESKTNAIDRAIANLMFNKMDFNVQDLLVAASLNPNQDPPLTHQMNQGLILPNDVEISKIFTQGDLHATNDSNRSLSRNTAGSKSFVMDFSCIGG